MLSIQVLYAAVVLIVALAGVRIVLSLVYRRGRQVEFRIDHGSATGEVLGFTGVRLRVRSLHSGCEHAVALTRVRRR